MGRLIITLLIAMIILTLSSVIGVAAPATPVANFSSNVSEGYAPLSVQFNDSSENTNKWDWNFGDETTSTEQNPVHTYSVAGNYTVTLKATKGQISNSKSATINVLKPIPAITWSKPADIDYGTALSGTQLNASASVPGSFAYNPVSGTILGAGTQTLQTTFTPADSTNYTTATGSVSLTVNKTIPSITWSNPADIVYGTPLSETQLNASSSVDGEFIYTPLSGTVLGTGTQTLNADFTPTDAANYTNAVANVTINVSEKPEAVLPVANFSSNVSEGFAPLTVQFNDSSENTISVNWDFNGDGNADSEDRNPVYEFTIPGNYTVNLTAINGNGSDSKSATINVSEKPEVVLPVANFSASEISGYAPLSIQFTDTSAGLPTSWEWNFGDGSPNSTEQNPNHTYSLAGTYTVVLNASNTAGSSINKQTNYIAVLNNSDAGSLTLVNTDFSQLSSIPRGMYIETTRDPALSNVTLTYNSTLKCADIAYMNNASGNLFFTSLYPTTDGNMTYTLGTEGVPSSSYVSIVASNSFVAVYKKDNGDYKLTSYWTGDDADTHPSYITVPAASIKDNKVTFSVVCYESNRTNMLKYNDTIYTKTPFRTMNTRNQNYVFVNQPMVYFSSSFTNDNNNPYVVHLYSIKQEIPRKTITSYGNRSISAFTITYPDTENNENGINLMKSNGQKSTIYVDAGHLDPATVAYEKALLDEGWEMGIHYTQNFGTVSNETAIATMDSEYNTAVNTFGGQPKTWCTQGSSGNISQAIYAYQRYGMIWRSCESGTSWISPGNLGNSYWRWWNSSIPQGVVLPAFTIATDKEPVTGSSINASYFTMFSNGFAANNIRLCGFNEYYFTQSAQNTTQVNITDSNNSYMRFTVTTSGYPCTLNVMTDMSNVEISHDGVNVPYTPVDDGVVFTATNNTTYELRSVSSSPEQPVAILPVANFSTNITEGYAPLTVQFNDSSENATGVSWDFNGDGVSDSEDRNPVYEFTTPESYTVNLTASNGNGTDSKLATITVSEKHETILPVANFSTNVTEGYSPLTVQFNDSSENAEALAWDFDGDGIADSAELNPVHEFITHGTYTVNLTASNGNSTNSTFGTITVYGTHAENYTFVTTWGSNGTGSGQFYYPGDAAVDSSGNIYVADTGNHRIQKFDSSGAFITYIGDEQSAANCSEGSGDGQFSYPWYVATDSIGNVYVADSNNNRVQKFNSTGAFITKWGSSGSQDGQFGYPQGVAVDSSGNVYVADMGIDRIQKFDSNGIFLTKWGSSGIGDGQLSSPWDVATDSLGNVYVADSSNSRIQKFDSSGNYLTQWGSDGIRDGQFYTPSGVAVDSLGNVYVADYGYSRIQKFDSNGSLITHWGSLGSDDGQFYSPNSVAVDSLGNVYVADTDNHRIQKFAVKNDFLPVANFSMNVTSGYAPLTVQFNDSSENATSVNWDFNNDGTVDSIERNPVYEFTIPGDYTVNLTATNENGADSKPAIINVTEKPVTPVDDQVTPPQSISGIQSSPESTWINWTWANPTDADFNHTEIYLNGIFQTNTSAEYFNATDLQPETNYTIGTRTADTYGNVNETWVNASAKTKPLSEIDQPVIDVDQPVIDSVVLFPANTTADSKIDISTNITDNVGVDEVTADNVQLLNTGGRWQGNITAPSSLGKYSMSIKANDAAKNTVSTSVPYNVVRRQGGVKVEVLPTGSKVAGGENTTVTIKVKNTQNIDDTFKVRVNVNGLPAFYRAGTSWFDWTEKTVKLRAKQDVMIPIEVKVPAGTVTGLKVFTANVNSEKFSVHGSDKGYLIISRPSKDTKKQIGPKEFRFGRK